MNQYTWSLEYCMNLTKGQITLFINKINKRRLEDINFQKAIHGIKPDKKGLNLEGAVPIEDILDKQGTLPM
jgi:hypothetical protein